MVAHICNHSVGEKADEKRTLQKLAKKSSMNDIVP